MIDLRTIAFVTTILAAVGQGRGMVCAQETGATPPVVPRTVAELAAEALSDGPSSSPSDARYRANNTAIRSQVGSRQELFAPPPSGSETAAPLHRPYVYPLISQRPDNSQGVAPQGSQQEGDAEELPVPPLSPSQRRPGSILFPPLPPAPGEEKEPYLPPLEEELMMHGGSYLYAPEGDAANSPAAYDKHAEHLRLPEDWQKPRPFTLFQEFLGADPIRDWPGLQWFGANGYAWEPRFVGYGGYQLFGFAFEQDGQQQNAIGHQLILDLDLRLTGTERFHMQFRPIGKKNTGGSYYQFTDPEGYVDNSTGIPDRFWFEGELHSMFQGWTGNDFIPRDYHVVVGRFPFVLHNALLINDDITGVVLSKNTIYLGDLSNLNVQGFYAFNDVDAYADTSNANLLGINITADYRHLLFEGTYARLFHPDDQSQDTSYAAMSLTKILGRYSVAGRALCKWDDKGGTGSGQLYVIETNQTRVFTGSLAGQLCVEKAVFYWNTFYATPGWRPISGGNFNRLQSSFAVDPLITISQGLLDDTPGTAIGAQFFRHHQDESITPEFAYQSPSGTSVWGVGITYQRKTGPRSFFEIRSVGNWSRREEFQRYGIFVAETILF